MADAPNTNLDSRVQAAIEAAGREGIEALKQTGESLTNLDSEISSFISDPDTLVKVGTILKKLNGVAGNIQITTPGTDTTTATATASYTYNGVDISYAADLFDSGTRLRSDLNTLINPDTPSGKSPEETFDSRALAIIDVFKIGSREKSLSTIELVAILVKLNKDIDKGDSSATEGVDGVDDSNPERESTEANFNTPDGVSFGEIPTNAISDNEETTFNPTKKTHIKYFLDQDRWGKLTPQAQTFLIQAALTHIFSTGNSPITGYSTENPPAEVDEKFVFSSSQAKAEWDADSRLAIKAFAYVIGKQNITALTPQNFLESLDGEDGTNDANEGSEVAEYWEILDIFNFMYRRGNKKGTQVAVEEIDGTNGTATQKIQFLLDETADNFPGKDTRTALIKLFRKSSPSPGEQEKRNKIKKLAEVTVEEAVDKPLVADVADTDTGTDADAEGAGGAAATAPEATAPEATAPEATATEAGEGAAATEAGEGAAATEAGEDTAATEAGEDTAATEAGEDTAATEAGEDTAATEAGEDTAATEAGEDTAATEAGEDTAATEAGEDTAATEAGEDTAATEAGEDTAATEAGEDTAATEAGEDTAATEAGEDTAATEAGEDTAEAVVEVPEIPEIPENQQDIINQILESSSNSPTVKNTVKSEAAIRGIQRDIEAPTFLPVVEGSDTETRVPVNADLQTAITTLATTTVGEFEAAATGDSITFNQDLVDKYKTAQAALELGRVQLTENNPMVEATEITRLENLVDSAVTRLINAVQTNANSLSIPNETAAANQTTALNTLKAAVEEALGQFGILRAIVSNPDDLENIKNTFIGLQINLESQIRRIDGISSAGSELIKYKTIMEEIRNLISDEESGIEAPNVYSSNEAQTALQGSFKDYGDLVEDFFTKFSALGTIKDVRSHGALIAILKSKLSHDAGLLESAKQDGSKLDRLAMALADQIVENTDLPNRTSPFDAAYTIKITAEGIYATKANFTEIYESNRGVDIHGYTAATAGGSNTAQGSSTSSAQQVDVRYDVLDWEDTQAPLFTALGVEEWSQGAKEVNTLKFLGTQGVSNLVNLLDSLRGHLGGAASTEHEKMHESYDNFIKQLNILREHGPGKGISWFDAAMNSGRNKNNSSPDYQKWYTNNDYGKALDNYMEIQGDVEIPIEENKTVTFNSALDDLYEAAEAVLENAKSFLGEIDIPSDQTNLVDFVKKLQTFVKRVENKIEDDHPSVWGGSWGTSPQATPQATS